MGLTATRREFLARALALAPAYAVLGACDAGGDEVRFVGTTMGTSWRVVISRMPHGLPRATLLARIEATLAGIDARMSTWRPDSEISQFNASAGTGWHPVSHDTAQVVAESLEVSRLSDGAFDVTVAPLVDLWGFGARHPPADLPGSAAIATAQSNVGYRHLAVRRSPPALRKARGALRIDLSAVAKGFAVDRVAAELAAAGVPGYLVEIGGEVRVHGRNGRNLPWSVAVERPVPGRREIFGVLRLQGGAIATSGDYRRFVARDGRRYAHVIDARTGRPVAHDLASATVYADSAMRADALATALLVAGPEDGGRLARRNDIAALLFVRQAGGIRAFASAAFRRRGLIPEEGKWNIS